MTRRYFLYQLFETLISDHLFSYRKISSGSVVWVIKIPRTIKPPQCNRRSEISLIFRAWKGIARRQQQQGVFVLFQLHNNHPGHLVVVYFMSCSPQTCITLILGGQFFPPSGSWRDICSRNKMESSCPQIPPSCYSLCSWQLHALKPPLLPGWSFSGLTYLFIFFVYPLLPLQLFHILNCYGALMSTNTFGT